MSTGFGLDLLEALLAERPEAARLREKTAFDEVAEGDDSPLVLFGAGKLGRTTLAGLRTLGIEPVAFTDSDERLWGRSIGGVTVLPPAEAARRHGESATFVVTIWGARATDRTSERVAQLRALGCCRIAPCAILFWKHSDVFLPYYALDLPHRVLEQAQQVRRAFDLFGDPSSRLEFLAQLRLRLHLDFSGLPDPVGGEIYFPDDLVARRDDEALVDCGAFDGDTLRRFLVLQENRFARIVAFEPDPQSFLRLESWVRSLDPAVGDRIRLHRSAVGASPGVARFNATGSEASSLGSGDVAVDVESLDDALAGTSPTWVKMDTEGSELVALQGGRTVLSASKPVFAVSAYHLQDHLWSVPIALSEIVPASQLFLRPHLLEGWDLVCYSIPPDRIAG